MNTPDLDSKSIILTMRCNLTPYNELTVVIEETFTQSEYSILAYDEMGDIWGRNLVTPLTKRI